MKTLITPCLALLATAITHAAPADDLAAAVQKLADAPNYSWTILPYSGNSTPTEGTAEKDGYSITRRPVYNAASDPTNAPTLFVESITVRKGNKLVASSPWSQDGGYFTPDERMASVPPIGRGGLGDPANYNGAMPDPSTPPNPAEDLVALLGQIKNVKANNSVLVADLTDAGVVAHLPPGWKGGGRGNRAPARETSGTVKFWLKNGALVKYEITIKGVIPVFTGESQEKIVTTTEIKNVGMTKVSIPDAAKKKLG